MTNPGRAHESPIPPATPAGGEGRSRQQLLSRVGLAVVAVVIVGGFVYAMAGTAGTTGSTQPTGGGDQRTDFYPNIPAIVQTVDKAVVQVRIREIAPTGLEFTVLISGLPEGDAGTWTAILDDGGELPLTATHEGGALYRVSLPGGVPGGASVDEVKLDPDPSDGDIYFEVP